MEELLILRQQVEKISYPENLVRKINGEITGIGFFPGAKGLIGDSKSISSRPIMILGQDQDNEKQFEKTLKYNREDYSSTWRNLKDLLSEADIKLVDCFFTNCLMGIRKGVTTNKGKSPSLTNMEFTRQCLEFLKFQLEIQKPKTIICLGLIPIKLLSYLSDELLLKFLTIETFKEIDNLNIGVNLKVRFNEIPNISPNVVVITHPSYRLINCRRRSYLDFSGNRAELEMIKMCIN